MGYCGSLVNTDGSSQFVPLRLSPLPLFLLLQQIQR